MVAKEIICSIHEYDANSKQDCPECSGSMHRTYDIPHIKFKGKGFYCTDYPKSVDKATKDRILKNEFGQMSQEAYQQIEEDEEEPYEGFMYKDANGKMQFADEKDVETKRNNVNINGKQYKVV
jgi:predicted nucleic acid-binding Zn ribbon protein